MINRRATELTVSPWARSIRNASWPPIYIGRPRPFQPGLADEREFPHDIWARCLRRAARNVPVRGDRSYNGPALQEALQRHLAEHRGVKAKPGQIIMVPSAQAGLSLIAKVMIGEGDLAWIESPGYGGALAALQSAGAIVAGVPLDASGLALRERKDIPRMIFVTPSHQYPTGRLMPAARRLELLRFAAAVGGRLRQRVSLPVPSGDGSPGNGPFSGRSLRRYVLEIDVRGYPACIVRELRIVGRHFGQMFSSY